MPGATSRWSAGKDLAWQPLRPERVCEVKYDHLQGDRFRHATTFVRWRPDKPPRGLPLRPARGRRAVRAEEDLRRLIAHAPAASAPARRSVTARRRGAAGAPPSARIRSNRPYQSIRRVATIIPARTANSMIEPSRSAVCSSCSSA